MVEIEWSVWWIMEVVIKERVREKRRGTVMDPIK